MSLAASRLTAVTTTALFLCLVGCGDDSGASSTGGGEGGDAGSGGAGASSMTGGTGGAGASSAGGAGALGGGGNGAMPAGGDGGMGGSGGGMTCTDVTLGDFILSDTEPMGSSLAYELEGLDPAQEHAVFIEFYGAAGPQEAGSYDLSNAPDDNYATCVHCLLAFVDLNGTSTPYYPASGTLSVTTPDVDYSGVSAGMLSDVVLVEVTLEDTVTEPVPGGSCLRLQGAWDTTQR